MIFRESQLAHHLLDGLKGIEIGGAAHNPFGLHTINVDRISHTDLAFEPYANEQLRLCGEVLPVDVVAPGNALPFEDKSYDFVISSHVIEHFFDPIGAIREWMRVARQYIFIIVPQRDALESDRGKDLTSLDEHIARFMGEIPGMDSDEHHSRWTSQSFTGMCAWICGQNWAENWTVCAIEDPDRKVGNGFTIVLKYNKQVDG